MSNNEFELESVTLIDEQSLAILEFIEKKERDGWVRVGSLTVGGSTMITFVRREAANQDVRATESSCLMVATQ